MNTVLKSRRKNRGPLKRLRAGGMILATDCVKGQSHDSFPKVKYLKLADELLELCTPVLERKVYFHDRMETEFQGLNEKTPIDKRKEVIHTHTTR